MAKKKTYIFKVKCFECNYVVQSKSLYDWNRCKCGDWYLIGGTVRPEMGGNLDKVRTLDGDVFFLTCRYDQVCTRRSWYGYDYCSKHTSGHHDEESFHS